MQWSSGQAGGFSAGDKLYRPAHAEGPFGYRAVNVADQRHEPGSLYSWVAQASRVRRESPELGRASGAYSTSVTRASWPSRPAGATARWSPCTTCQPSPRRSACPMTRTRRPGTKNAAGARRRRPAVRPRPGHHPRPVRFPLDAAARLKAARPAGARPPTSLDTVAFRRVAPMPGRRTAEDRDLLSRVTSSSDRRPRRRQAVRSSACAVPPATGPPSHADGSPALR